MRLKLLAASYATLFAHTMAVAAQVPLTPNGPWNVEFADSMCLLSRPYAAERPTNLIIKPAMIGDGLEIIVTKATTSIRNPGNGKAVLTIAGKQADSDAYFTAYSTAKLRVLRIGIKDDQIALSSIRGTLSIDTDEEGRHLFAVAGIERALPVLSGCVDQLRVIYKVSKADLAAIATLPIGRMVGFFSNDDYPLEAVRNGQFGTVGVLVWVESNGRISTCEVIETSAAPILDKATCDVLKRRARLTPATDVAGKAVRGPSFTRIRWALP